MCFFVDLSQLQHFMPTLVKRMHMLFNPPEKGGPGPSGYAPDVSFNPACTQNTKHCKVLFEASANLS